MVLQWDPHHKPDGSKVENKRPIQLGVKGEYANKFHSGILKIENISEFVKQCNVYNYNVVEENLYPVTNQNTAQNLLLTTKDNNKK